MKKESLEHEFLLALPKVDNEHKRVIQVEGSSGTRSRVICYVAFPDMCSDILGTKLNVTHWAQTVLDALNDIISEAYIDAHFGGDMPADTSINFRVQTWLNVSPHIIDVDPSDPIKLKSALETVHLDIQDEPMSHNARIFQPEWTKLLDPTSTPTSEKVNIVYKMAKGASIKHGKIYQGKSVFCSTVHDNAIATVLNPRRAYLLRTTFENSVQLVSPEVPKIAPRDNHLHGVHLNTAVMHLGAYTYEDAICVSKSAADKMACGVKKAVTFRGVEKITPKVSCGDIVKPKQVLAVTPSGGELRAEKILFPSEVERLDFYRVIHHGRMIHACRVVLYSEYHLKDGDKLSNRGAGKGVVCVLPDGLMPIDPDGNHIEVIIGPESIAGRRALVTYWEMMAHKAIADGIQVSGDLQNPSPSFRELVEMGYGSKVQLRMLDYGPFIEKTFIGPVFWIRINKHACEQASAVGEERILNSHGVLVDDAKVSGQRMDLAKAMALHDRGFDDLLAHAVVNNSFGNARLKGLIDTLR